MGWEVKNLLSCQSKHGLVGSSAKTRNFLSKESQEWKTCTFLGPKHKSAIWDGTPPNLHIKSSLYVWRRAHGSQIFKRNSIISIRSCFIAFLGGLSLHLNHLIASRMTNYDWQFGTLPFGIFWSNLGTMGLETYARTYNCHFWHMSLFDDSRAVWVFSKNGWSQKIKVFSMKERSLRGFLI